MPGLFRGITELPSQVSYKKMFVAWTQMNVQLTIMRINSFSMHACHAETKLSQLIKMGYCCLWSLTVGYWVEIILRNVVITTMTKISVLKEFLRSRKAIASYLSPVACNQHIQRWGVRETDERCQEVSGEERYLQVGKKNCSKSKRGVKAGEHVSKCTEKSLHH